MNSKVLPFKFHFEDFQLENRKKKNKLEIPNSMQKHVQFFSKTS